MMRICNISPSGSRGGGYLLTFENEERILVSEETVLDFSLQNQMELSDEMLDCVREASAEYAMKRRAYALLSRRPYARQELMRKLSEEISLSEEAADRVLARLEELGLLNDRALAENIASHYFAKGYGARRVREELRRRGIPRELWEEALSNIQDAEQAIQLFLEKKLGDSRDPKDIRRAANALLRRGYTWEEIRAGISQYGLRMEAEME